MGRIGCIGFGGPPAFIALLRELCVARRGWLLRIRISRVFGSRRESGAWGFGTRIPALLVYEKEGGPLVGVYPHTSKDGPLVTISEFLNGLAAG